MCKKQTSVSHCSTESKIISLDAGLRMDGIPSLDQWDVVIEVLHSSKNKEIINPGSSRTLLTKFQHQVEKERFAKC